MNPIPDLTPPDFERFMSKLVKRRGCWEWTGALQASGYGIFKIQRRIYLTHRVSASWLAGLDIATKYVCHKCDNPPCCNPEHLFAGTAHDNSLDMLAKGRASRKSPFVVTLSPRDTYVARVMLNQGRSPADVADYFAISVGDIFRHLRHMPEDESFEDFESEEAEFDWLGSVQESF